MQGLTAQNFCGHWRGLVRKHFAPNLRVPGPMLRCEERQDVLCQLRCDRSEPSDDLVMIYGYQGGEDGDEEEGDVVP